MKKLLTTLFIVAACGATAQTVYKSIVIRLGPTTGEDVSLFKEADQGQTADQNLMVNAWTAGGPLTMRALFRFNMPTLPANGTFVSAQLMLYANTTSGHPQGHSSYPGSGYGYGTGTNETWLKRVTTPWSASTVKWSTQPSTGSLLMSLPYSSDKYQDYVIDVTALVRQMLDSPSTSYGFALSLQNEATYRSLIFASSEHLDTSKRPKLVINYTTPVATGISAGNAANEDVHVAPNPATDILRITFPNSLPEAASLMLIDVTGRVAIRQSGALMPNGRMTLSVASLPRGLYFLRVSRGAAVVDRRVVLE